MSNEHRFIPHVAGPPLADDEIERHAREFHERMQSRRTVRQFSNRPVTRETIERCLLAAGTAPSGANRQPWHFAVVFDAEVKRRIRIAAEKEEHEFYGHRAPAEWLEVLEPLGTDEYKPFLEHAGCLVAIFVENYGEQDGGGKRRNYYAVESVGIATGLLIAAIHHAGLVCLTHTPSPMRFLNEVLARPKNERPFLLLVVGHPDPQALVPDIQRKTLDEIASFL